MLVIFILSIRLFLFLGSKMVSTVLSRLLDSMRQSYVMLSQSVLALYALLTGAQDFKLHPLRFQVCHLFSSLLRKPEKVGIAILTRFPIPERVSISASEAGVPDLLQSSLKHSSLLDRILTELTANCLATWLEAKQFLANLVVSQVFLVYRTSYSSAFELSGWLSVLPNHSKARKWHEKRTKCENSVKHRGSVSDTSRQRLSDLLWLARCNAGSKTVWEDPSVYCSWHISEDKSSTYFGKSPNVPMDNTFPSHMHLVGSSRTRIEYVTVPGLDFVNLLEVAVRAALRSDADYIIVLNPRALNLRQVHLTTAVQLLSGQIPAPHGGGFITVNKVDIVFGLTKPCSSIITSEFGITNASSPVTVGTSVRTTTSLHSTGLFLLGIRGDRHLTVRIPSLIASVEWSAPSTASRLWANIAGVDNPWSVCCLRDRLEELMQAPDLLALERYMGVPAEQFLSDTLSVIIPLGPGHPDDALDVDEDTELINVNTSKALASTLEILVHNASGHRPIEIILIDSSPAYHSKRTPSSASVIVDKTRFRTTRLRPMITVSCHHYEYNNTTSTPKPPRRGELIRYAVDHFARGSTLLFIEPGIQLPPKWDSAVVHSLQRPGIALGCFAYRLHLPDKYVYRKSLKWAASCYIADYLVHLQTRWSEIPIVGQPCFIHSQYLACLGGYPTSSRALHSLDLAIACRRHLGRLIVTRSRTAAAGVPANFALRHGAFRTAFYTFSVALARYFGASEEEVNGLATFGYGMISLSPLSVNRQENAETRKLRRLPLVQPHYLDGY
ncbi:unnamed protein product [Dicrocoelium dendriticum]|nr:unnamed protein product [Dicrocoelium dendriticum]CAH8663554.1 unnamed protein product [Dicrocoelium dendriticum]